MKKAALLFIIVSASVFVGLYAYHVSTVGVSFEELFLQAVGVQCGEEEGGNGPPIVVSIVPYVAIISALVGVGVILRVKKGKTVC